MLCNGSRAHTKYGAVTGVVVGLNFEVDWPLPAEICAKLNKAVGRFPDPGFK
jgi:hypothetical protein